MIKHNALLRHARVQCISETYALIFDFLVHIVLKYRGKGSCNAIKKALID
jgi:hypothetical protein